MHIYTVTAHVSKFLSLSYFCRVCSLLLLCTVVGCRGQGFTHVGFMHPQNPVDALQEEEEAGVWKAHLRNPPVTARQPASLL